MAILRRTLGVAALALAGIAPAQAQFVGTVALASENRYRGTATDDVGPVLRASVMGDTTFGAYGGLSGIWRTRDAELVDAVAIAGWSGRLERLPGLSGLDPRWGWDLAWQRTHYGESARYDFTEAMVGLLAPGWSARLWWSPHYFGSDYSSLYGEVNASRELDEHWRVYAHVGGIRYGPDAYGWRPNGRIDGLVGVAWALDAWDLRLSRDGLLAGSPAEGVSGRRRRAGWVLSGSVSF